MNILFALTKLISKICLMLYPMINVGNSFLFFGEIPAPSEAE